MFIDISNLAQYNELELIDFLKRQDDLYENDGESDVPDDMYDTIRRYTELTYSGNIYFTGVGSDVRGGKVRLPYNMSGLTQVYENEMHRYISKDNDLYVISEKLDGTSAQVIYDANGTLQIAFSRGNGFEAADITRHIKKISNIPKQLKQAPGSTLPIRMEMIISKSDWLTHVKNTFIKRNGEPYVNARAFTAGSMNSSSNEHGVYQYIKGIAYTIIDSDLSKQQQFDYLKSLGFDIARYQVRPGSWFNDNNLTIELNAYKASSDYELDGVVVNVDEPVPSTPLAAFKYKVTDASNVGIAVVNDFICSISKDSYLKPTIHIQAIELNQVTIRKCTGFNMKYIIDNEIQPGCKIRLTRSGDVIPFCLGVQEAGPRTGPDYIKWVSDLLVERYGEWSWSKNQVDAILSNKNNKQSVINRLTDIFTKLRITHLKDGNIEKLYDAGYDTVTAILNMDYTELYTVLGENGTKVYDSMEERLNGIYWPEFVGSLGLFGRGIGRKKLTKLYDSLKGDISKFNNIDIVAEQPDFDYITAEQIQTNYENAIQIISLITTDLLQIKTFDPNLGPKGTKFVNQSVVFTGIRSPEVEQLIVEQGGTVASGVSKTTTIVCAKDPNSNSGKAKKARDINQTRMSSGEPLIQILTLKELEKLLL